MPRPATVVLGWVAATAAAIAVAYAGVSTVAGDVVEPLPAGIVPQPTTTPTTPASPSPDLEPSVSPSASQVRSYALVGGSATLRYEPGRVTVVSAEPAQGFTVEVEGNGTAEVRVEFDSDDHRSRLRGSWEGGPRERVEEDD